MSRPTGYCDLDELLGAFVADLRSILGADLVGAYLQGSFALGEADPHSDVDFVVVTSSEIREPDVLELQSLHGRLFERDSPWAEHLEGSYVPKEHLRHVDPAGHPYLYLNNGSNELTMSNHCNTAVMRWILHRHGVPLCGPEPSTLVAPVSVAELRAEARRSIRERGSTVAGTGEDGTWMSDWEQGYLVLTFCRMLYTLHEGVVCSKSKAGEWALSSLDGRWARLIRNAIDRRPNPWDRVHVQAREAAANETRDFVRYASSLAER
jgi:hypothetical protein